MQKKYTNRRAGRLIVLAVSLLILMQTSPGFAGSSGIYQSNANFGQLRGFIYKPDGKTPLWGAQVVLQHVKSRRVFRSNVTDNTGDYQVIDVPAGDYLVLILSQNKSYKVKSVDFLIKIFAGKTTTISFSLNKPLKGLLFFLLRPCCLASVISATLVIPCLPPHEEEEQSPTQR